MVATNRWLGPALVGLLALVAQPAAVVDASEPVGRQAPEAPEAECQLGERVLDRGLADAQALPEVGEFAVCLGEGGSVTPPTSVEELTRSSSVESYSTLPE